MKTTILLCWVGNHDLEASKGASAPGPICQAVLNEKYSAVHLLYNYNEADCLRYRDWLRRHIKAHIHLHHAPLENPMHFEGIYAKAQQVMDEIIDNNPKNMELTLHLSPGTSAMAAAWIILGKVHMERRTGQFARLINSSIEAGVQETVISFDLAVFKPAIKAFYDQPLPKGFIAKDPEMLCQLDKLKKIAPWDDIAILILGSTGTGKERFAEMVHAWNEKHYKIKKPFVAINCAAIPDTLVEAELFGTEKGKITDVSRHTGKFQEADGGILFMDEIGELSTSAQAKVLRAIQEKKITRVGGSAIESVNVRIIAATNRDLTSQVSNGNFREDLYYRLAQATIIIPSLQQRPEDISLLAKSFLIDMNKRGSSFAGYKNKEFSPDAIALLKDYHWPGNIRELQIVINQAAIWTDGKVISAGDIRQYLSQISVKASESHPLLPEIGVGMSLEEVVKNIKKHYADAAYNLTLNQDSAAHLLGYKGRSSIKHLLT